VDLQKERADNQAAREAAAQRGQEEADQGKDDPSKTLLRWVAKLGAGIVSGLGLAGVVGLIGSAVLWERFDQAGLPATQALAVVPDDQRVIEGANGLIVAMLVAFLAVAVLFSLDRTGRVNLWSRLTLWGLVLAGVIVAITTELPFWSVFWLALLAIVLALTTTGVGKVTKDQFAPFAFAFFISAVVYAGAMNFSIAADQNFIQPAAVLKSMAGQGIRGFYVADDDDAIWIGVIRADNPECETAAPEDSIPLYRIPKDEDTRLLIGQLKPYAEATCEAEELRQQLKETSLLGPVPENNAPLGG
jgi:hypothetical protein